jgi:hypothetical protein
MHNLIKVEVGCGHDRKPRTNCTKSIVISNCRQQFLKCSGVLAARERGGKTTHRRRRHSDCPMTGIGTTSHYQ